MAKITLELLDRLDACSRAVREFREAFGEEVEINEETIDRAVSHNFENYSSWLVGNLLTEDGVRQWRAETITNEHSDASGHCPGCVAELRAFAKIYNIEEYRLWR